MSPVEVARVFAKEVTMGLVFPEERREGRVEVERGVEAEHEDENV